MEACRPDDGGRTGPRKAPAPPWGQPFSERAENQPLEQYERLCRNSEAVALNDVAPTPLINGDDLIRMGVERGPVFKRVLDEVYYRQLNLELTNREDALAWARGLAEASGP